MYRKIAFTSIALNVVFVLVALFGFVPWIFHIAKDSKIEMPLTLMLLLEVQHFITNPQSILPTLAILLVGFWGLKAFGKRRTLSN